MPALTQSHGDQVVLQRIRPARPRRASRDDDRAKVSDEEAAYAAFFRAQFGSIVRTIHLIVHDRARAEDISQEAFLQLFRQWSRISAYDRPDAWVRRVAIRLAVRALRRDAFWTNVRSLFLPRPTEMDVSVGVDVIAAVGRLPRAQRTAIVLHYYEDRPVAEIAQLLGCSEPTARVHLHRGRRRLAELLREDGGEADGR
jgi:RNA polymerase sigma-70 factor (ECF subfamily)